MWKFSLFLATRCPVVFWTYVKNHAVLRALNPGVENPLELAKDHRAIYKYMPHKEFVMEHNHV